MEISLLVYFVIGIASVIGWTGALNLARGSKRDSETEAEEQQAFAQQPPLVEQPTKSAETVIWQFFAIASIINVAAITYVTIIGVSGPHGRYLSPARYHCFRCFWPACRG